MDLLQGIEKEKCRRSAHYFIFDSKYLKTKDEHDLDNPTKLFLDDPYLRVILDFLLVSGRILKPDGAIYANRYGYDKEFLEFIYDAGMVFIEKSRQVLATWIICTYIMWRARFLPHQLILVQSKREDDAANLVFTAEAGLARISFMEWSLPRWLQEIKFPKGSKFAHLIYPNGSHIWGIPEGSDIIRSNTVTVLFGDECGFQPEFGHAYTAALPSIKGGGQGIFISSAEPSEFADLLEAMP